MKLWQLHSVCRTQPDLIESRLRTEPHWQKWLQEFRSIDELVDSQNRSRLDAELPDDLVRSVLGELRLTYYLSDDGWLRSRAHGTRDKALSALGTFELYGGAVLEEVLEYGSVQVS